MRISPTLREKLGICAIGVGLLASAAGLVYGGSKFIDSAFEREADFERAQRNGWHKQGYPIGRDLTNEAHNRERYLQQQVSNSPKANPSKHKATKKPASTDLGTTEKPAPTILYLSSGLVDDAQKSPERR
jgi:hypothetical protein